METVGLAAPEDKRTPLLSPGLLALTRYTHSQPINASMIGSGCVFCQGSRLEAR
jgi:hypothetical protein